MKHIFLILLVAFGITSFADCKAVGKNPLENLKDQKVEVDFSPQNKVERTRLKAKKAKGSEVKRQEEPRKQPDDGWLASHY